MMIATSLFEPERSASRAAEPLVLLSLLLLLFPAAASTQDWTGNAALGVQVRGGSGKPLAGAEVEIAARHGGQVGGPAARRTDSRGQANFVGIAPGTWSLEIHHPEHLSYVATVVIDGRKKPEIVTQFLEVRGTGRGTMKVKFLKSSQALGQPLAPSEMPPALPAAEAAATEPEPAELPQPDPQEPVEPEPAAPAPVQPAPSEPIPSGSTPSESTPTEPGPSEPASVTPGSPEPVETAPVSRVAEAPEAPDVAAAAETPAVEPEPAVAEVDAPTPQPEAPTAEEAAEPVRVEPEPPATTAPPSPEMTSPAVPAIDEPVEDAVSQVAAVAEPGAREPTAAPVEPAPAVAPETPPETETGAETAEVAVAEADATEDVSNTASASALETAAETIEAAAPATPDPVPTSAADTAPPPTPNSVAAQFPAPTDSPPESPAPTFTVAPAPGDATPAEPAEAETEAEAMAAPDAQTEAQPLRSYATRTCAECKPGEWAADATVAVAPGSAPCRATAERSVRRAMRDVGTIASAPLANSAGPLELDLSAEPFRSVTTAARTTLAPYLDPNANCRFVGVVLPAGARFSGFRSQASDTTGVSECLGTQDCAIGGARFVFSPGVVRGEGATLVFTLFENTGTARRNASLSAYFEPTGTWRP